MSRRDYTVLKTKRLFCLLFLPKIVFKSGFSAFFQQRKSYIVQMNNKKDKYAGRCLLAHGKMESEDEYG